MKGASMSDLISRRGTIRTMWDRFNSEYNDASKYDVEETKLARKIISDMQRIVEAEPAAYDVEAVVEQLDKASYKADCLGATVKYLNFDDTVHIVRAGGKE